MQKRADEVCNAVRFPVEERRQLEQLAMHEASYLVAFARSAFHSEGMVVLMRESASAMAEKYAGVYGSVKSRVIEPQAEYSKVVQSGDALAVRGAKVAGTLTTAVSL